MMFLLLLTTSASSCPNEAELLHFISITEPSIRSVFLPSPDVRPPKKALSSLSSSAFRRRFIYAHRTDFTSSRDAGALPSPSS